jgi:hypothetical protein
MMDQHLGPYEMNFPKWLRTFGKFVKETFLGGKHFDNCDVNNVRRKLYGHRVGCTTFRHLMENILW